MAEKLKDTLVKSPISAIPKHRATVKALGLTKLQSPFSMVMVTIGFCDIFLFPF